MSLEGATLGIYRLGAELGRGGMGAVYRGESIKEGPAGPAGAVVAVKIFHAELVANERAFARFRFEAEIGKEIRHDHLVRTYGIGSDTVDGETHHFMVMDVIEGRNLKDSLAELGTYPEHLLYSVADQALGALAEIHARGVVHRDIKPENIIITPDHRVLLMDLGVARRETAAELVREGEFVGSLIYAPPEQFTATEAGPRADIYAFGVSLYELALGRHPYGDMNVGELLQHKLYEEIAPPRQDFPDLDPFWDQVIYTCVRRDPSSRFASAAVLRSILAEGERGSWWQARKAGKVIPNAESALKRLRLERSTLLVGRDRELAQVHDFQRRAVQEGGTVLLCGPAGTGKSRLLYEYLLSIAAADGPLIAAGRCVGSGGRGYQPFVEILTDLLQADRDDPDALEARATELLDATPDAAQNLAGFLLGRVQLGDEFSKDALHNAAGNVVRALAGERFCVIVLEDLHLAAPETLELLEYLQRALEGLPVALMAVMAEDEIDEEVAGRLAADARTTRVELGMLGFDQIEELVQRATASDRTARTIARPLYEKSGGNPLIVLEMVNHLRTTEQLIEESDALEFKGSIEDLVIPSSVSDLAGLKLARLDEEERRTLELGAVVGFDFNAQILADALDEKRVKTLERLAGLERRHKLIASAGRDSFRFASRQLFDATYGSIDAELRGEYHDRVAERMKDELDGADPDGATAYELLRHMLAAGRAAGALPYLETALDHIDTHYHASYAAPFAERVATALGEAPAKDRFTVAMRLWTLYERLANRADQLRIVQDAAVLADEMEDPAARARVHAYRAGSHALAGDYDASRAEAQAGLELARAAGNRKWEATNLHTLGLVCFRQGELEAAWDRWSEALAIRREIEDRHGEANTLLTLAAVMPAMGKADEVLNTMLQSLVILRKIGHRRGEARMLMNLGAHYVNEARYEEGLDYFRQAIAGHRELGARVSEGMTLTNLGHAQHMLGRIDDARRSWRRALGIFVDLEDQNGELTARTMLGSALTVYGEFDEARDQLRGAVAVAERIGNKAQLINALRELGHAQHAAGELEAAWASFDRALTLNAELNDPRSRVKTAGVMARVALDEEDFARAAQLLEDVRESARGGPDAPLILCRLAQAHRGAGHDDDARSAAEEALACIEGGHLVSTFDGPEIYYTLHLVLGRDDLLEKAREMVEARAAPIRNDSFREHFLTRVWPNREIASGARPKASPP
ncbi:MAG: tetratricopeptide repeat protein [Planctomycetota bacterium]|nr:tetratricopeptide repeat protein [Planctomycetota bacterium]